LHKQLDILISEQKKTVEANIQAASASRSASSQSRKAQAQDMQSVAEVWIDAEENSVLLGNC